MPFVHKQLLAENLFRFVRDSAFREGHAHPFYYMEGALMAGFLPWTPLLMIVFGAGCPPAAPDGLALSYLMVWFVVVLLFYNLPQSKRGVYLLALYPALATLLAIYVEAAARILDVSGARFDGSRRSPPCSSSRRSRRAVRFGDARLCASCAGTGAQNSGHHQLRFRSATRACRGGPSFHRDGTGGRAGRDRRVRDPRPCERRAPVRERNGRDNLSCACGESVRRAGAGQRAHAATLRERGDEHRWHAQCRLHGGGQL